MHRPAAARQPDGAAAQTPSMAEDDGADAGDDGSLRQQLSTSAGFALTTTGDGGADGDEDTTAALLQLSDDDLDGDLGDDDDFEVHVPRRPAAVPASRAATRQATAASAYHTEQLAFLDLQSEYLRRIESLETRLAQSTRDRHEMESRLKEQQQAYRASANGGGGGGSGGIPITMIHQHSQAQAELDDIRRGVSSQQQLVPTELQYVELQSVPEGKRSLLDRIRCRLFEELHAVKNELHRLRRSEELARENTEDVNVVREKCRLMEKELYTRDQQVKNLSETVHKMESELAISQQRAELLQKELQPLDNMKTINDELQKRLNDREAESQMLRQEVAILKGASKSLAMEKEDFNRKFELLKLDKSYLEKEVATSENRIKILEEKLAVRTSELESVKEAQLQQFQNIVQSSEKTRAEYEARLQEELSSIRKRTATDLDDIRKNARELYEREIQMLKDNLIGVTEELRRTERVANQLKQNSADLMQQYHTDKNRLEHEVASVTQQLKTKAFECDRFRVIYEDTLHQLKRSQFDNEKLLRKVDILTKEYQDLQSDTTKRLLEMEIANQAGILKRNAQQTAVKPVAPADAAKPTEVSPREQQGAFMVSTTTIELRKELTESKKDVEKLRAEIAFLENLLSKTRQPYQSLIVTLRERDTELKRIQNELKISLNDYKKIRTEKEALIQERNTLLSDVQSLLQNRQQMEQIRQLLVKSLKPGAKNQLGSTASLRSRDVLTL